MIDNETQSSLICILLGQDPSMWEPCQPQGNTFSYGLTRKSQLKDETRAGIIKFCKETFGDGGRLGLGRWRFDVPVLWWSWSSTIYPKIFFKSEADMIVFLTRWQGEK